MDFTTEKRLQDLKNDINNLKLMMQMIMDAIDEKIADLHENSQIIIKNS